MPAKREEQGHNVTQIEVVLTAILAQKVTNGYLSRQILGPVSHRLGHHAQPLVPQIAMLESNSPMTSDIGKDRKGGHCMHPRVEKGTFCKHELSTPQTPKPHELCVEIELIIIKINTNEIYYFLFKHFGGNLTCQPSQRRLSGGCQHGLDRRDERIR